MNRTLTLAAVLAALVAFPALAADQTTTRDQDRDQLRDATQTQTQTRDQQQLQDGDALQQQSKEQKMEQRKQQKQQRSKTQSRKHMNDGATRTRK